MIELWKPVTAFDYEVSSQGRIRNSKTGKILKPAKTRGYDTVTLVGPPGTKNTRRVHRLVAEAFIPNPQELPHVLHGRNGAGDNSMQNLRWGTPKENARDTLRDGNNHEKSKTHCPRNHPYNEENTRVTAQGYRECKLCRKGVDWDITDHGLGASYARGCRCQPCRDAVTRYSQRGIREDDPRHGSYAGYRSGCRCANCKKANSNYERARVQRKTKLIE